VDTVRAGIAGILCLLLGIYSGRPDPSWTLTDEQAAALDQDRKRP